MIKIKNLSKSYNNNLILDNITVNFTNGLTYILGRSGAGKTTLLNLISGFIKPTDGIIKINNKNINTMKQNKKDNIRKSDISFIFDNNNLINNLNVYDNIAYSLRTNNVKEDVVNKKVLDVLETIGMTNYKLMNINKLSGGEQKKIAIARALVKDPSVILADEITSSLDNDNKNEVMSLIKKISENITVIMITHDEDIVKDFPSKTYLLENKTLKLVTSRENNEYEDSVQIKTNSYKSNYIFHIKDSLNYFKKNIVKLLSVTLILLVLSSITAFFLSVSSFDLYDKYEEYSKTNNLSYINFKEKDFIKISDNNILEFNTLLSNKNIENQNKSYIWGFPFDSNTSFINVIFINEKFGTELLEGNLPTGSNEVVVTDYYIDNYANNIKIGDSITIYNNDLIVSGIYNTNYIKSDNVYVTREKEEYLNVLYMYEENYKVIHQDLNQYEENVVYINGDLVINKKLSLDTNNNLVGNEVYVPRSLNKTFKLGSSYVITLNKYKKQDVLIKIVGYNDQETISFSLNKFNELNELRFGYLGLSEISNLSNLLNIDNIEILNQSLVKPLEIYITVNIINNYKTLIVIVFSIFIIFFLILSLHIIFNYDIKTIGIKRTLGVSKLEIYLYYFTVFIVVGLLSLLFSIITTSLVLYLYDLSFTNSFKYLYLKLSNKSFIILILINLFSLNISMIPYLKAILNKNEISMIIK